MIVLITGASHTGKTALAQKLLETYKYPYFSIDHLKMGLIRSGNTVLTPLSDDLIVEGCYIPFEWQKDFEAEYLKNIKYYCLVMSHTYIRNHFDDIKSYACVVENRMDDEGCTMETVLRDNAEILEKCQKHKVEYLLIDNEYRVDIKL